MLLKDIKMNRAIISYIYLNIHANYKFVSYGSSPQQITAFNFPTRYYYAVNNVYFADAIESLPRLYT